VKALVKATREGDHGIGLWLCLHGALHFLLLSASSLILLVVEHGIAQSAAGLVVTLWFGLLFVTLPTMLVSVIMWVFRGLRPLAFRAMAIVFSAMPLVCMLESGQLVLLVPLQVAYAVMLGQPKEVDWSQPGGLPKTQ
jgi:hypothetical protein